MKWLIGCAVVLAVGCHGTPSVENEGFTEITATALAPLVGKPDVHLFDVNHQEDYTRGHLPGARLLSMSDMSATTLPADKAATLVFYCKRW